MDKVEKYRQIIQKILTKYSNYQPVEEGIETQLIFDTEREHYQLLELGWEDYDRIYNCVMHLDIKDEKIWIQRNITDILIAEELVDMGVAKEDIILGLQPPYKRPFTKYGEHEQVIAG
ncbi:XisI protein [Limnoraphis robusta Tam1]|uniref:XisI protein n=1 Tax=Limnoraphis robusta CCNP1315 TaxID=3110306 RepID=A0ABU5U1A5_9CYAN|nr:XisI protein [Limnoraphis robusta]MEA5495680.1 XisI protein [Limnoraphis robusta BA-68 BA1]MEA5520974.1 XisI protein [Limnoraphis robusta CCNP1315]MEA5538732.1 XisI protein [Limnoraphis robusta Tam1]MEA5543633.1 XisI protein [Limnoraphis robusta CCNP1324]